MQLRHLSTKTWTTIAAVVAFLVLLNVVFFYMSPEQIVSAVGVDNTYAVVFLIAAFGGINILTSGILYTSIATFAAGGASPFWIGIAGGIGIAIGDLLMFTLFRLSIQSLHGDVGKVAVWTEWLQQKLQRVPKWLEYGSLYLVLGFTPMPNDIIMFFLASAGYRYRTVIPLLLAGCITVGLVIAYIGEGLFTIL